MRRGTARGNERTHPAAFPRQRSGHSVGVTTIPRRCSGHSTGDTPIKDATPIPRRRSDHGNKRAAISRRRGYPPAAPAGTAIPQRRMRHENTGRPSPGCGYDAPVTKREDERE